MNTDFPAFDDMTTDELVTLMLGCSLSPDPSDKEFAQACREEIKRRKPQTSPSDILDGGRNG